MPKFQFAKIFCFKSSICLKASDGINSSASVFKTLSGNAEKKEGRTATVTDTFQFALPTKSKTKKATGQTHSETLV